MKLLALTALVAIIAHDPFPAPRTPTPVLRISCRQGECQWQQIQKIELVRADRGQVLRKVTSRTGTSTHGLDRDPPSAWNPRLRVAWEKGPSTDYVLCSKRRPATAFWDKDERKWIVTSLDLTNLGGYQYAAGTLYMEVCHSLGPDRWSERGARRMGYGKTPSGQERYGTLADMLKALG